MEQSGARHISRNKQTQPRLIENRKKSYIKSGLVDRFCAHRQFMGEKVNNLLGGNLLNSPILGYAT